MKIVSWNCHQRFDERSKLLLENLPADIYVIQECADPEHSENEDYKELLKNGFWIGGYASKGMAVFTLNENLKLERLNWDNNNGELKYFLPVKVNDKFTLVGVWTQRNYCVQCFNYITANETEIDKNCIFIGDFNSNITQDYNKPKMKTWAKCVEFFEEHNLCDAYHYVTGEEQGKEKQPTYYQTFNLAQPYHFDHCIIDSEKIQNFEVCKPEGWLIKKNGKLVSDHMPIMLEIKD